MAEQCTVYVEQQEVAERVDALGLTDDLLHQAVKEGIRPMLACTKNDPDYLPGILGTGKITRALRDRVVKQPFNWTRERHRNQPSTVRPDNNVAIIVAGGDEETGIETGKPMTRSAKGRATRDAIAKNLRSFSEYEPTFARFDPPEPVGQTWVLLYFYDKETDEVRLELSLPKHMDKDDHVNDWQERIILASVPIDRSPIILADDDEDDDGLYDSVVKAL